MAANMRLFIYYCDYYVALLVLFSSLLLYCKAQSSDDNPCLVETSGSPTFVYPQAFIPTFHDSVYFEIEGDFQISYSKLVVKTSSRPYDVSSEPYLQLEIDQKTATLSKITPSSVPGAGATLITIRAIPELSISTEKYRGYLQITEAGIAGIGIPGEAPFASSVDPALISLYHSTKYIGVRTQGTNALWNLCNTTEPSLQLLSHGKEVTLSEGANSEAANAFDGTIATCTTFSNAQTNIWFRIDLDDVYEVALVEINPGAYDHSFFEDAKIRLGSCEGDFEIQNQAGCDSALIPNGDYFLRECETDSINTGQFVNITIQGNTGQVAFCEVRIFGRKVSDEDATIIQFATIDVQPSEDDSVELEVVLLAGNRQSCVSVDIIVYDNQGTLLSREPVSIPSGPSSQQVPVSWKSEDSEEETESVSIRLENSVGARIGDRNVIEIFFNDTDSEEPTDDGRGKGGQGAPPPVGAIVGGVVGGIIIVVLIVLAILLYRSKRIYISSSFRSFTLRRKLTRQRPMNPTTTEQPDEGFPNQDYHLTHEVQEESGYLRPEILSVNQNCEIDRSCVELHEILGTGANGEVYRATANGVVFGDVAVKKLKAKSDKRHESDFKKELDFLKSLEPHPNIIGFIGCCTDKEPYYLILEYAAEGNLQTYLRKTREEQGSSVLKPADIIRFALDITKGMEYIASKNCIHRDLATRNVLLSEGKACKLSDFGLARAMEIDGEYEMKSGSRVPVRWMAPESILDNKYSIKTDVWSFGVVLWELVTMGAYPYGGMNAVAVVDMVNSGRRLSKPEHCHDETYNFMLKCWDANPKKRPDFRDIHAQLDLMMAYALEYVNMPNIKRPSYLYLTPQQEKKRDEESTREMIEFHFEQQGKAPRIPPKPLPRRHIPRQIHS